MAAVSGHSAEDHGDAVVHSACCAGDCECNQYSDTRYVITARFMFDNESGAEYFMQNIDNHHWGEIARDVHREEV